jgi:hypothetical protein
MVTAKRFRRIDVWPDHRTAVAAVSGGAKALLKMTIWPHEPEAAAHMTYGSPGGSYIALESAGDMLTEGGDHVLLEAA